MSRAQVVKSYSLSYFRTWEIFLGWSAIIPEKGSSTCFQIVMHKNLDTFNRCDAVVNNCRNTHTLPQPPLLGRRLQDLRHGTCQAL